MRLVSSQSFPHLWKKLWKFQQIRGAARFPAGILADFGGGETRKGRKIGLSQDCVPVKAGKTGYVAGRSPAKGDLSE